MAFAFVAPLLSVALWNRSIAGALGVLALSHMLLLYPTLRPNAQWLGPVAARFRTTRREVWLTIDDGPTSDTTEILALFAETGVRATFFVKGEMAEAQPALIREILAGGHSVGNHSQTHPSGTFWCASPGRIAAEIDRCNEALSRISGTTPSLFRAPIGHKNPFVHPALARRKMRLVGWTARGFDAVVSNPRTILSRLLPHIEPGAIVLMHQGPPHCLPALALLVATLHEQGYRFIIPNDDQLTA